MFRPIFVNIFPLNKIKKRFFWLEWHFHHWSISSPTMPGNPAKIYMNKLCVICHCEFDCQGHYYCYIKVCVDALPVCSMVVVIICKLFRMFSVCQKFLFAQLHRGKTWTVWIDWSVKKNESHLNHISFTLFFFDKENKTC